MRAVVQRVTGAGVRVDGADVARIGPGLLVLVGVTHDDAEDDAVRLADKIRGLRVLPGERSVADDPGAGVLVVSQFTLYGDARKGRRPTWSAAAPGSHAEPLITLLVDRLASTGTEVRSGIFGADMQVDLVNDGPFTVLLET